MVNAVYGMMVSKILKCYYLSSISTKGNNYKCNMNVRWITINANPVKLIELDTPIMHWVAVYLDNQLLQLSLFTS